MNGNLEDKYLKMVHVLAAVKDLDEQMEQSLRIMRSIFSADAGSIFIYDMENSALTFKYTQNDKLNIQFKEFSIPLDDTSIAGYSGMQNEIVRVEDVYQLSSTSPFKFNTVFDKFSGYVTKSILAIPLNNLKNELIGVLQLINKIDEKGNLLEFTEEDQNICHSLSGIIAVSLENSILYENIEEMWESFIKASIQAIEARDIITRGHTDRVTKLSLKIAEKMSEDKFIFSKFKLDKDDSLMLKYACLLHDFGKIGVREFVLQKSKKLSEDKFNALIMRLRIAENVIKSSDILYDKLKLLINTVCKANDPSGGEYDLAIFEEFKDKTFTDYVGNKYKFLESEEFEALSIIKGSLTASERKEMESHVYHTYKYLINIPWTKKLKKVPKIACMHHEKLDGTGYPFGLKGDAIDIMGRIMAVADIYDALTAKDRPYKKSMSPEEALKILEEEADNNKLDSSIVNLLAEYKLYNEI